jgi:glycosyltransferase involved in cell wall biosynthesis
MVNRRISVLFIVSDLAGGGAERVVSTMLRRLDRARFAPSLCLWRDIRVYSVPQDVPVWVLNKTRPWHTFRTIWRTARLLERHRPDVISTHLPWVNLTVGLAMRMTSWSGGWLPCLHNVASSEFAVWLLPFLREILRPARRVLAVSEGVRRSYLRTAHLPERQVVTCYNPIDFDTMDPASRNPPARASARPTVITMGRLIAAKDHATLLRAFAKVRKRVDAELVILGEGPLRAHLESLAAELGIREHVRMPGFLADPFGALAGANVFALSSRWEGLPTALIEAMAIGLPCVSTRCPSGPDEIIEEGTSGLLVDVGDADTLGETIARVLQDPGLARRFSQNGRRRARSLFSAQRNVRSLEELIRSALEPCP